MLRIVGVLILSLFAAEIRHACSKDCKDFPRLKIGDPCDPKKIRFFMGDKEIVYDYRTHQVVTNSPKYDPEELLEFILPGMTQNHHTNLIRDLVAAYNVVFNFRAYVLNVIVGEYDSLVDPRCFNESQANLEYVGHCMAHVLNTLNPPTIEMVGYEMGASVMTVVSNYSNNIIKKLTALDPAAVLIHGQADLNLITTKNRAFYKDCYHTAGNRFAVKCGDSDWYMNLGQWPMPGCPSDESDSSVGASCSSLRSIEYYLSTIIEPEAMYGFRCKYLKAKRKIYCPYQPPFVQGGEFVHWKDTKGLFKVITDAEFPYGRGYPKGVHGYYIEDPCPTYTSSDTCDPREIRFFMNSTQIEFDFEENTMGDFKYEKKALTLMIFHGSDMDHDSEELVPLRQAYEKNYDYNVIMASYPRLVNGRYCSKQHIINLDYIGNCVAKFLKALKPKELHTVGYSMGAKLLPEIARYYLPYVIGRATGLDPAGSAFDGLLDVEYITPTISNYTDIIHTNGNRYKLKLGHSDWFLNFGYDIQPGCPNGTEIPFLTQICSHSRALLYYTESVRNKNAFFGSKCDPIGENCMLHAPYYRMGESVLVGVEGQFLVRTNSEYPYGKGKPDN